MKAVVMYENGQLPQYADVAEPVTEKGDEIQVSVRAVALKHFDKGRATGKHYSATAPAGHGRVVGGDGVCLLPDGIRVYAMGTSGMLAEKAIIDKDRMVKLPSGLDDNTAAALPNAVIGSAMGLRFKAGMQRGDVVLINGATGFTGRVAVQVARYYGAKRIIVTGRNKQELQQLRALGADEIVYTGQEDAELLAQLRAIHQATPVDVVIDYLWGHTAEIILTALKGTGAFTHKTRFVSVGSVTGDIIQLSAANLRSVDLQLTGSGLGSWTREQVAKLFSEILPEMFQLAADGKIKVETMEVNMKDIGEIWNLNPGSGQRVVVKV